MKKLVALFAGVMMAVMVGMVYQAKVRAQMTTTSSVSMPVMNMVGTWSGTLNAVSAQGGYADDVAVTLTVSDQQTDAAGNTYFRGNIIIDTPFGTGTPSPIAAAMQITGTNKSMQTVSVMWVGMGIEGCGMGTSVVMPSGNTVMIHGCLHVPSGTVQLGGSKVGMVSTGPIAASAPAMAIVDLTKQ